MNKQPCEIALQYRNRLRMNQTPAEKMMHGILRKVGVHYKCQKLFQRNGVFRIVDFYLPFHQIAIEVDGGQHFTKKGRNYDKNRERFLMATCRIKKFIRFPNSVVLMKPEEVEMNINRTMFPRFSTVEQQSKDLDAAFKAVIGL